MRIAFSLVLLISGILPANASNPRPCVEPDQAAEHAEKDICVAAHVYDIAEGSDGTRYLDVCKPGTPDEACRFTVINLPADRKDAGDLDPLRGQDVHLRGVVHVIRGQSMILLTHARQFHDGAEKFRPNPTLMAGFSAEGSRTAFRDPALKGGRHKGGSVFLKKPE